MRCAVACLLLSEAMGTNVIDYGADPSWPGLIPSLLSSHYSDIIMGMIVSQFASLTIAYSNVNSGADQIKHRSSASLAFVLEIHWWPVNSLHKWPVTQKMFPFDDVIMVNLQPKAYMQCAYRNSEINLSWMKFLKSLFKFCRNFSNCQ